MGQLRRTNCYLSFQIISLLICQFHASCKEKRTENAFRVQIAAFFLFYNVRVWHTLASRASIGPGFLVKKMFFLKRRKFKYL